MRRGHPTPDCIRATSRRSRPNVGEQACISCVEQGMLQRLRSAIYLSSGRSWSFRGQLLRRRSSRCKFAVLAEGIFHSTVRSVNKSLKGKWAALACHETGSLVVQVRWCIPSTKLPLTTLCAARFRKSGRVGERWHCGRTVESGPHRVQRGREEPVGVVLHSA